MQGPRVLHGHERVAFEDESGTPHQHCEKVVIEGFGILLEKSGPDLRARSKPKGASNIESPVKQCLDEPAPLETPRYTVLSPHTSENAS